MLQIKHIASNTVVTPMPSGQGRFGDETLPNCSAEDCCLVMAARTTALRSLVSQPTLTKEEREASCASVVANKDAWTAEELAEIEVTTAEVEAKRDSIRGYTEAEVEAYIEETSVEADAENNIEAVVVTDTEAREALHKKEHSIQTMRVEKVEVPDLETIELELIAEKEEAVAERKCKALIDQGFLVTDLSATDEDNNEIYADWKAQFEVIEQAEV